MIFGAGPFWELVNIYGGDPFGTGALKMQGFWHARFSQPELVGCISFNVAVAYEFRNRVVSILSSRSEPFSAPWQTKHTVVS